MTPSTSIARTVRLASSAAALIVATAVAARAQDAAPRRSSSWEVRVASGAYVGMGAQRQSLKDGSLTSLQVSRLIRPQLAVTGTFAWARSRDLASFDAPKLDVFTSDLGLEVRSAERGRDRAVSLSTFAGFGGGARSYNHRALDLPATHNLAAYASVGGEMGLGRVALRLEARDYTSGFRPLAGSGTSVSRNDVVVMGALRFNRHRATRDAR